MITAAKDTAKAKGVRLVATADTYDSIYLLFAVFGPAYNWQEPSLGWGNQTGDKEPSGTGPPTQIPLRLDAAILSRTRSPITSRSNWAKDNNTFKVRRPMLEVVLNDWVTETNETSCSWSAASQRSA